jgi:hypothetical protein
MARGCATESLDANGGMSHSDLPPESGMATAEDVSD